MAQDKKYHFVAGFIICLIVGAFNPAIGLMTSMAAGALKEVYDYHHPDTHTADLYDMLFTWYGGIAAAMVWALVW